MQALALLLSKIPTQPSTQAFAPTGDPRLAGRRPNLNLLDNYHLFIYIFPFTQFLTIVTCHMAECAAQLWTLLSHFWESWLSKCTSGLPRGMFYPKYQKIRSYIWFGYVKIRRKVLNCYKSKGKGTGVDGGITTYSYQTIAHGDLT